MALLAALSSLFYFFLTSSFLLLSSLLSFLLFLQLRNWSRYRSSGCNIPALPEKPFIGSFRFQEVHVDHLYHQAHVGNIAYSTVFHLSKVVASDADVAQIVLQKQAFPKSAIFSGLGEFWGANLLVMVHHREEAGAQWRHERSLVNPAFKLSSLRELHPTFAAISVRFTQYLLRDFAGTDRVIDFPFEIAKLTLNILSSAGLNYPLADYDRGSFADPFLVALQDIVEQTGNPLLLLPYGGRFLKLYKAQTLKAIDDVIFKVIDERIQELQGGSSSSSSSSSSSKSGRRKDILDMMLQEDEEGRQLSRDAVRNELLLFYLAGHETSANSIAWTIYCLCRHPEILRRVHDEIHEVMGPVSPGVVDAPTLEQAEQMTYLEMVLQEVLRLYPPVPFIPREIPETFEHNGLVFPKGAMIELSPFLIQRDPKHWPDPERFDPERFSKENSKDRHPFAYFPFSGGPRICIGRNFYFQEAKATVACLLRHVSLSLDFSRPLNGAICTASVALKPKAVWLKVEKRLH